MIPKGTISKQAQSDIMHGASNPYWAKKFNAGETVHFVIERSKRPYRTQHGTTVLLSDGQDGVLGWEYKCDKFAQQMNQFHLFPTLEDALVAEMELNVREAEYQEQSVKNIWNQLERLKRLYESCKQSEITSQQPVS